MALNFPASPSNGQEYVAPNGVTYIYDAAAGLWYVKTSDAIGTSDINDGAITTAKLADDAVTGGKLANDITISTTGDLTANSLTLPTAPVVGYQQGLWAPTYGSDGTAPTISYSTQDGTFSRVGNLVTATYRIDISSKSGGSGNLQVNSFPYAAQNRNARAGGGVGYSSGWLNNKPPLSILATSNESFMRLYTRSTSTNAVISVATADIGQAGCVLYGVVSYLTDDTTWTPINGATVS